jgi:hypothetical protein
MTSDAARICGMSDSVSRKEFRRWKTKVALVFAAMFLTVGILWKADSDQRAIQQQNNMANKRALVISGNETAVKGCNRDFVYAQRVRAILNNFNVRPDVFPLLDCREVLEVVTQNPEKAGKEEPSRPLYPGAPYAPDPPPVRINPTP